MGRRSFKMLYTSTANASNVALVNGNRITILGFQNPFPLI